MCGGGLLHTSSQIDVYSSLFIQIIQIEFLCYWPEEVVSVSKEKEKDWERKGRGDETDVTFIIHWLEDDAYKSVD